MEHTMRTAFSLKPLVIALLLGATGLTTGVQAAPGFSYDPEPVWSYGHSASAAGQTSEIPAYDHATRTVWVVGLNGVDVLNAKTGELMTHIDTTAYGSANSVAIHDGLAAVAVEAADRVSPGQVLLFDTVTRAPAAGINAIPVGSLPDMLTFSHDGERLLVANEASPFFNGDTEEYEGTDPEGNVSVIDMATRTVIATPGFLNVPTTGGYMRSEASVGIGYEPEYIAIDHEGKTAYVTIQEHNAIGVLDLKTNAFTELIGLGLKDFSAPGNEIDPNDKDSKIELRSADVLGLYQPDAIAAYKYKGQTYLVMANEGDTREDDGDKTRAGSAFGDLARLNISTTDSSSEALVTFGGRSFSIRDTAGNIVFDSGNALDAAAIAAGIYDDGRSDDKGVEPEGVELFNVNGRTLAFIGLERTKKSAVAVYDVTHPHAPVYLDLMVIDGDVSPEGLKAFRMSGKNYLAVANEVSGTTSLIRFNYDPRKKN
jgi:hypothetical protein